MKTSSSLKILIVGLFAATLGLGAAGSGAPDDFISVERQLRLKRQIMLGESSLLATLQANRRKWDGYTDEHRRELRQRALAFRQADPAEQQRIIEALERFNSLSPQRQDQYRRRAAWIGKVMNSLDEAQRRRLNSLPPTEKAAELIRLAGSV